MKLVYTYTARGSLRQLASYLKKNNLDTHFIKNYIKELREGISKVLTTFPEAGVVEQIDELTCKKIIVKDQVVLYQYKPEQKLIKIIIIYRHNLPTL